MGTRGSGYENINVSNAFDNIIVCLFNGTSHRVFSKALSILVFSKGHVSEINTVCFYIVNLRNIQRRNVIF